MRTYYKSFKTGNGALMTFKHDARTCRTNQKKDGAVFLTIVKQTGWNEKDETGTFAGGDSVTIKFGMHEVGELEEVIQRGNWTFNFYHDGGQDKTSGFIRFYDMEAKTDKDRPKRGVSFLIKKNTTEFKTSLTVGEANDLLAYLNFARREIYAAICDREDEAFLKRQEAKKAVNVVNTADKGNARTKTKKAEPVQEEVDQAALDAIPDPSGEPDNEDVPF
jgi:hypothetical protein